MAFAVPEPRSPSRKRRATTAIGETLPEGKGTSPFLQSCMIDMQKYQFEAEKYKQLYEKEKKERHECQRHYGLVKEETKKCHEAFKKLEAEKKELNEKYLLCKNNFRLADNEKNKCQAAYRKLELKVHAALPRATLASSPVYRSSSPKEPRPRSPSYSTTSPSYVARHEYEQSHAPVPALVSVPVPVSGTYFSPTSPDYSMYAPPSLYDYMYNEKY
jgi:hypothetical protein